jgi:predicted CXXCH cytochrome family protein
MDKSLSRGTAFCAALLAFAAPAVGRVQGTRHDLSAPGARAAGAEGTDTCSFCHTNHASEGVRAAWDMGRSPVVYKLYESSTLLSSLRQPTGASRLCLSCHDGTTAPAAMAGRSTSMNRLRRAPSLGTDLSDDHPISLVYDQSLAARHGQLADPSALPSALRLDASRQLQCTTCHDAHEERYGHFLAMDNRGSALCTACHHPRGWEGSSHATFSAAGPLAAAVRSVNAPGREGGCASCHQPHNAPRAVALLRAPQERDVCLSCHGSSASAKSVEQDLAKPSAHAIPRVGSPHKSREDPLSMPQHVTCADCHNSHQAGSARASAPAVGGALKGVSGVDLSGQTVAEAANEYEVCLKCHGVRDAQSPGAVRQDDVRNLRLKIAPGNASYHPIASQVRRASSRSLKPGLSAAAVLYCSDCHGSDERGSAGARARGPHGSRHAPILELPYTVEDDTAEAPLSYALCYKCHDRESLLRDQARSFPHTKHVVDAKAPCAICHDAHGSRTNPGLINFVLRDRAGKEIVSPSRGQGRIEYQPRLGQCALLCHGKNHEVCGPRPGVEIMPFSNAECGDGDRGRP